MKKLLPLILLAFSHMAFAGVCEKIYDGEAAYKLVKDAKPNYILNLYENNTNTIASVTKKQVVAFKEAKDKIQQIVGLKPQLIICADSEPNAFAMETKSGMIVGVTAGMLKILDGDENMTAAVVGHEIAHHTSNHRFKGERDQLIVNILTSILGIYIEGRMQREVGVAGIGTNLAVISSALTLSKFSRDQEREADEKGLNYMAVAGYNPEGAIRLAEVLSRSGNSNSGLFYDTHPSWDERATRLRTLVDTNPKLKTLVAQFIPKNESNSSVIDKDSDSATLDVLFSLQDSEKLFNESFALYKKNRIDDAIKLLIKSAELGNATAQANLCEFYLSGKVVKQNLQESLRLCKASAAQGNPAGQFNLGYLYFKGAGVEQDSKEGLRLYRSAVEQNFGWAITALAQVYQHGFYDVPKNNELAMELYLRAAELGEAIAYAQLGSIYSEGVLVEKNMTVAVDYLKKGVNLGNTTSASALGLLYLTGNSVTKDEKEGERLIKFAADKNDVFAQYNLAIHYGNKGDNKNATVYYKLAAKNGLQQAKNVLEKNRIPY